MTATPYQPATGSGSYRTGYWDEQIESNRFRVTFAGNSITSRETVERYLLYRAAELTVQNGGDYFVLSDRDTEKHSETYRTPGAYGPGPWGGWSPYWRFYRPRWGGWRSYDPFWDDPFWMDRGWDYRQVDRYEAMAEIVTGRGPKPADNVRAFDAREVLNRLGPSIQAPQPGRR
ncbi:CC0125/CC1285 family lipoprotein [Sphingomonas sp. MMS12-HWE2-04]|uniref:CC0125/CC1285 family lipoprotein n=1 Tax=Sphingomonas sp. MMS12-HWE2-04 TaxID=3234199 RepID=UPI003850973B